VLADAWAQDVLSFWLKEIEPASWFKADAGFDQDLRRRFSATHGAVANLPLADCLRDADTALAAVIVLDQFSRNMFRGTPRAFATDAEALRLADAAIAKGFDARVADAPRLFFYLPFEHAEDRAAQARGVALIGTLPDAELVTWAEAHKRIIDRFGRFPHRNAILGRASTPEELEFLSQPGSSF